MRLASCEHQGRERVGFALDERALVGLDDAWQAAGLGPAPETLLALVEGGGGGERRAGAGLRRGAGEPGRRAPHRPGRGALASAPSPELAREIVRRKLAFLEEPLAGRTTFVGDTLTLADLAWYTRVDLLPRLGVELEPTRHPHLLRWFAGIRERLAGSEA